MTNQKKPSSALLSPSLEKLFISQLTAGDEKPELFAVPISVQNVMLQRALNTCNSRVLSALAAYDKTDVNILETLALQNMQAVRVAFISRNFTPATTHLLTAVLKKEKRATVFADALKRALGKDTYLEVFNAALKNFEKKPTVAIADIFFTSSHFEKNASLTAKLKLYKLFSGRSLSWSYDNPYSFCEGLASKLSKSDYASEAVLATTVEKLFVLFFESTLTTKAVDHIYEVCIKTKTAYMKNTAIFVKKDLSFVIRAAASFKKTGYVPPKLLADLTWLLSTDALSLLDHEIVLNVLDKNDDLNTISSRNGDALAAVLKNFFALSELPDIWDTAVSLLKNPNVKGKERDRVLDFLSRKTRTSSYEVSQSIKSLLALEDLADSDKDTLYLQRYSEFSTNFSYSIYADEEAAKLRLLKKSS